MGMSVVGLFDGLAKNVPDCSVIDMTTDSRRVVPGGLFLACQGAGGHGLDYMDQALAAGAAAVAWNDDRDAPELPDSVAGFSVSDLDDQVGVLADRFFDKPSERMPVTGVTGTNGKTTTAWLATGALNKLLGRTAYLGTVGYGFTDALEPAALTTPGVIAVHRRLAGLADQGAVAAVMEVSSHGLDQGRVDNVRFKVAAFTNLSRDHLDYHGSTEAYQAAKAKLFTEFKPEFAVLNVADEFGRELARLLHKDVHLLSVSADPRHEAALCAEVMGMNAKGMHVRFSGEYGEAEMITPLWGRFNAENLVVAAGILLAQGFELKAAVAALASCDAPAGRMEVLPGSPGQPLVVVDFAHTPDALQKALESIREHCDGALWCVFGCGGDRDSGKRSQMGSVAEASADQIIITDDNPRDEDPAAIVAGILEGFSNKPEVIHDRAAAINAAVSTAKSGDVVLIAGKGSETYQISNDQQFEFSDRDTALRALGQHGEAL